MDKDIIYVRIDRSIKEKLDMIALDEDRSLNNLVVRILTKHVEEYEKNKKDKNIKSKESSK